MSESVKTNSGSVGAEIIMEDGTKVVIPGILWDLGKSEFIRLLNMYKNIRK